MKTIERDGVKTLVPEDVESVHDKAKRIAAEEITKAGCAPNSAHAAIIHMRVLRSLHKPQIDIISPQVAQQMLVKSEREAAHRSSPLSFIRNGEEEVQ